MNSRDVRWVVAPLLWWIVLVVPALTVVGGASAAPAVTTRSGKAVSKSASVTCVVLTAEDVPVPHANLRVRDVRTGDVAAVGISDTRGAFGFEDIDAGWYAVEVVGANGNMVALGQPFPLEQGASAATVVRLAPRRPSWSGRLSNAAQAVIAAASSAGVTAFGSAAPAASPY